MMVAIPRTVLAYKLRAASASLALFVVFTLVLALLASRFWYPDYLFWCDGGLQGLRIVLSVDLVLGPVLALVFFHPEKSRRKLLLDIVVVAVLQLSAMAWGAWQVWSQRPVAVVFGNGRFISVAPDIMARQHETAATLARFSPHSPPYVFRRAPQPGAEAQRHGLMVMRYGLHPEAHAFLFEPFLSHLPEVFGRQAAIRAWLEAEHAAAWETVRRSSTGDDGKEALLAFYEGRYRNAVLLFDRAGNYLGYLDLGEELLPYLYGGAGEGGGASVSGSKGS